MMAASAVSRAVAALALPQAAMDGATRLALRAGYKENDAAVRLYREWVNDTVALAAAGRVTLPSDPAGEFLAWVAERVRDPYRVGFRAHGAVRARLGDDVALAMGALVWKQEIAWARRMRSDPNDRVACLAALWLTAARRDPGAMFKGLADCRAEAFVSEPGYLNSSLHDLSPEEIESREESSPPWKPLWLTHANREFRKILNDPVRMPRERLESAARQARDAEAFDRDARRRSAWAETLRVRRPSLMLGVLSVAVKAGLSSDDLLDAEKRFVAGVEGGSIDISSEPGWRVFTRSLASAAGTASAPSPAERERRVATVQSLLPTWPDTLPPDLALLGCRERRRLMKWFDEVAVEGGRTPPADPAVDYGMWLVERERGCE